MTRCLAGLIAAVLMVLSTAPAGAQRNANAEAMMEEAWQKENLERDVNGAIKLYKEIAAKYGKTDRAIAVQALLRMAGVYQKQGDAEARRVYERVEKEFGDQPAAVAAARAQLGMASTRGIQLVCSECVGAEASMSADGRWVVFHDMRSGDIAVRDMITGQARRLAARAASSPVLSRDGKQVAYLGGSEEQLALRVISTEPGATSKVITKQPGAAIGWSADGKSVLAILPTIAQPMRITLGWVSADGAVRAIRSGVRGPGSSAAVSPDGRYVAFALDEDQNSYIYVQASDGSSETPVVRTAGKNTAPVWTPDGKQLLFLSNRTGKTGLWSIAIVEGKAGGNASEIVADLGDGAVTPLGVTPARAYQYVFEQDGVEQITIVPVDKGGRKVPGPVQHLVGTRPSWSPDGKYLMFQRRQPGIDRGANRGGPHYVMIHNAATGEEKTFSTPLGNISGASSWFRDSKHVMAWLEKDGKDLGAYRLNVETGELQKMFDKRPTAAGGGPVILSPDEKTLYFFQNGMVARDLATGQEKRVLSAAGGRLVPALSPDGTMWAISRRLRTEQRRFFGITDVDGGNLRELYSPPFDMLSEHVDWTPDSKTMLFHQSREEDKNKITPRSKFFPNAVWPRQVMRLSIEGGAPEYTGIEADGWMLGALAISPDGKRGAYSYVKPVSELRSLSLGALK